MPAITEIDLRICEMVDLWEIMEWCEDNCKHDWWWAPEYFSIQFESDDDAILFKLSCC